MTDWAGSGHVEPLVTDDDILYVTPDMTFFLNNDIYWSAPHEYIGNKVQWTILKANFDIIHYLMMIDNVDLLLCFIALEQIFQ